MHATDTTSSPPPHKFDRLSFLKYTKEIGRAYRSQVFELISICRTFARAKNQNCSSYNELRSVLQVVDDALYSAMKARRKTSEDANVKFKKAADALGAYEKKYHSREGLTYRMAEAEAKDKSSLRFLNSLENKFRPLEEGPTKIVEFLLHKSPLDINPTTVKKQVLSPSSDTKEILWNFSRFNDERRLTLKDNPHFYEKLPTSAEQYEGQFRTDPVETFQQQENISVLTDNSGPTGRVFFETAKEKRVFGNVWVLKEAIIFKDVNGRLEGEYFIGSVIKSTPNLWCFEEPPLPNVSWPSLPDRSSPPLSTTATPITSPTGALLGDWREPILRMLRPQGVKINIRFSDRPPISFSSDYSEPSLPSSPPPDSISIIGSQLSTRQSRPTLGIQIPGAPQGPPSPSSYKTARSTPLTTRPPAVEMSPRPPSSISSLSPETPTPTGTGNATALTGPAVPDCSAPDTPTVSLREPSLVDVIPSQSDTYSILTSPTSTISSPW